MHIGMRTGCLLFPVYTKNETPLSCTEFNPTGRTLHMSRKTHTQI